MNSPGPRRLYIYLYNDVVTTSFVTDKQRHAATQNAIPVFGDLDLGPCAFPTVCRCARAFFRRRLVRALQRKRATSGRLYRRAKLDTELSLNERHVV